MKILLILKLIIVYDITRVSKYYTQTNNHTQTTTQQTNT